MAHDLHVRWARRFRKEDGMKVVRTGTRISAFASLLLVGACMADENTAGKTELGVSPADGTSGGGGTDGGGTDSGNIDARFAVAPLTSDQPGVAPNTDPQLQDVWGVTSLQDQFFAVAQATGQVIGLAPGGEPTMHIRLIEETARPGAAADKTATGIAVLQESDQILMDIGGNCNAASLLVAAQSGRLWAVNPDISQDKAFMVVDRSKVGAQYTGVAVLPPRTAMTTGGDDGHGGGGGGTPAPTPTARVLAVDFHNGRVDQFDVVNGLLERVVTSTSEFVIPNLPTNFAPFGILATSDRVILTAAERRTNGAGEPHIDQQAPGDGKGIVAAFDRTGKLLWRTQSSMFNIPWGLAMGDLRLCATSALLVGQHGDATKVDGENNKFGGTIIAMDVRTGKVIQPLLATDTQPVRVQGLWGLTFATGITNIEETRLHLGAGPVVPNGTQPEVEHGLFARLDMTRL
jgi:hypothetical protein